MPATPITTTPITAKPPPARVPMRVPRCYEFLDDLGLVLLVLGPIVCLGTIGSEFRVAPARADPWFVPHALGWLLLFWWGGALARVIADCGRHLRNLR